MPGAHGRVRIIGGRWRGTRIEVLPQLQLRPSADRVRETLFNWLAPDIDGARCLDLFAGTGVLGFEALSRGAAHVTLVERDRTLTTAIDALAQRLDTTAVVDVVNAEALRWLDRTPRPFDIGFLDPPFDAGLVPRLLDALARGWLTPHARVYLEHGEGANQPGPGWTIVKEGHTRHVSYKLLERTG